MRDTVWEVSADSPYGEWFFQGKQDPISEAACSELRDVLWEVLHYRARHELFIHLLSWIKTCCSIAWAHAFLAALWIHSVCWLSRKQTMKSPSTISKVVCTLSDRHRGWEEGLTGMRRRSHHSVCHTPSPDTSLLLCKVFSDDPFCDSEMRKKKTLYSQPLDISGEILSVNFYYYRQKLNMQFHSLLHSGSSKHLPVYVNQKPWEGKSIRKEHFHKEFLQRIIEM